VYFAACRVFETHRVAPTILVNITSLSPTILVNITLSYRQNYDTTGKTRATPPTLLFHRANTISLITSVRDRDRPTKQSRWGGSLCFTSCVIRKCSVNITSTYSSLLSAVWDTGRCEHNFLTFYRSILVCVCVWVCLFNIHTHTHTHTRMLL
jgi:hypothetical protein